MNKKCADCIHYDCEESWCYIRHMEIFKKSIAENCKDYQKSKLLLFFEKILGVFKR